jgi:hypothetical protein
MAYIDSELAKRLHPVSHHRSGDSSQSQPNTITTQVPQPNHPAPPSAGQTSENHRTTQGKLHEVDLGPSSGPQPTENTPTGLHIPKTEKIRLGPDGKPWRRRKRRTSADIERDALVERVLHENASGITKYDIPSAAPLLPPGSSGDNAAADEILAETFRREFLEAVGERQRMKRAVPPPPPSYGAGRGRGEEEVLKGPKLGGSRTQRAVVREMLLKQQRGEK